MGPFIFSNLDYNNDSSFQLSPSLLKEEPKSENYNNGDMELKSGVTNFSKINEAALSGDKPSSSASISR